MMTNIEKINGLKEIIFAQHNDHCFIEKERFLASRKNDDTSPSDYYPKLLSDLLDTVSTPIDEHDIFVGRVIEGACEGDDPVPNRVLAGKGHLIPDYNRLLTYGFSGILEQIKANAKNIGTQKAFDYASNAEIVINAIRRFAKRYAQAAKISGHERAHEALLRVPFEPAYDLYSALQCIWLMHMIESCYVGGRDYAFGYMDEYLYPYYLKEKEKGTSDREISEMFAGFFVKANEICGRHPHNYKQKPIICHSSKQYVLLDGGRANELSCVILDAAKINCMAQPIFTVVLSKDANESFKDKVFETMAVVTDKLQVFNCELHKKFLANKGLPSEIVDRPAYSACCTFDIYGHSIREEFYLPTVQIFCKTLFENEFSSKEELLTAYSKAITAEAQRDTDETRFPDHNFVRKAYVLDSLLLSTCNEKCEYLPYGAKYRAKNIFLPGIATLGDSLCALDTLVFNGDVAYSEFIDMLKADFENYGELHERVLSCKKFGNDNDCDRYTVEMAELLIGAIEKVEHTEQEIIAPSIYSLERNNLWANKTPATPDGRRAGTPFSENQSPVYGADKNGITALLNSISKLPFERTPAGGLNLTFSSPQRPEILKSLITTYFENGGLHTGITVLDRKTLEDAMIHPEKYRSLTVRMYGFSEYFITLPKGDQIAVMNRTAY